MKIHAIDAKRELNTNMTAEIRDQEGDLVLKIVDNQYMFIDSKTEEILVADLNPDVTRFFIEDE